MLACGGVDGTVASVEQRVILQRHHSQRHRLQRRTAGGQHGVTFPQGPTKPGVIGRLGRRRHRLAPDGAGAAVNGKDGLHV